MQIPQRISLTSQTVQSIQQMIASGELTRHLPGERTLATQLQIGRDTLRTALTELEKQGWISVGEHGKRRQILKKPSRNSQKPVQTKIGLISPKRIEELPPLMLLEIDRLREMLGARNIILDIHTPPVFHTARPGKRLADLVDENPSNAWILYQTPEVVQRWFAEANVPSIVRGHTYPGIDLPSLDTDWQAAGLHAASLLTRAGHQSIGLIMPDTQLQGLFAAQKGIESALANVPGTTLHCVTEKGTTDAVANSLHAVLRSENPPTAVISTRARQVLTLISWLATHRLSIPQHISLVSLTYDPTYEALLPKIDYYFSDPEAMARNMTRLLTTIENGVVNNQKTLIPDHTPGDSVRKITPS